MKNTFKKVATVLLAGLMCLSLTACTKDDPDTPSNPTEVTYKDTFKYAVGGVPSSLDPSNAGDSVSAYFTNQFYFGLYHIGEDGNMVKDSVKDVTISDDGLTYTFTLIDNKWSDGKPVTAEDFVYGVKHTLSVPSANAGYKYFITDHVKNTAQYYDGGTPAAEMTDIGCYATDANTLVFELDAPCPYFISLLSCGVFYPIRSDYAVDGDIYWADTPDVPVNGAYYVTYVDKNDRVEMKKNPYFYNADEVVTENLIALVVEDMDAQLMQFQAGDIDFASAVDATTVAHIYAGSEEFICPGSINYYLNINSYGENKALANRDVRRALQLGVDRQLICDALDAEGCYYPISGFVPKGVPGVNGDYAEETPNLVYTDYEEAKALLAKAGYDKPDEEGYVLTVKYSYNASTMHTTIADVLAAEYKKIGVKVVQETSELRTFFSNRSNGAYDLARNAFSADYNDVSSFLALFLYGNATVKTQGDETYDAMFYAADALPEKERLQAFHEAEKYFVEEMAYNIPLIGYGSANLVRKGTTGCPSSPQANNFFWYVKTPA